LVYMYTNQSLCIKWGTSKSSNFKVSNGVKQGAILSQVLFTVYMDELFLQLKESGVGCYVGNSFMGGFGYADDGAVGAPTVQSLRLMLNICNQFGKEFNVIFNLEKYQFLFYANNRDIKLDGIYFNNIFIEAKPAASHLGHPIGPGVKNIAIVEGTDSFVVSFNGILTSFPEAHVNVKYKLFKTYCMPLYGCVLWDFTSKEMSQFFTQWRKCIRRLFNLDYKTHCKYLPAICEDIPVEVQMFKKTNKICKFNCK